MTSNDTTSYKSNNSSKTNYVDTSASYRLEDQRVPTPTHGSSITEHTGNNFLQIRGNASTLEIPYQIRPKTSDNSQRRPSTSSTYENQNLDVNFTVNLQRGNYPILISMFFYSLLGWSGRCNHLQTRSKCYTSLQQPQASIRSDENGRSHRQQRRISHK